MFEEEFVKLESDLDYRIAMGGAFQDPPYHFSRVIKLFNVEARNKILKKAHRTMRAVLPGKYTIQQFVIMSLYGGFYQGYGYQPDHLNREMIFSNELDAARYDHSIDRGLYLLRLMDEYYYLTKKLQKDPTSISLTDLPSERDKFLVTSTVDCENTRGLGSVLAGTIFSAWQPEENNVRSEILNFFQKALHDIIISDTQAAGLASCAEQLEFIFNAYGKESNIFINDAGYSLESPRVGLLDIGELNQKLELLYDITKVEIPLKRPIITKAHDELISLPELCDRYCLEMGEGGFYIPIARRPLISRTIRESILLAEKDRSSLLALSPRKFEIFMAAIFEGLGYEVSLSKASRDGGVDLLCLKSCHGIPFSLAVEVKRYTNKPVDVRLIRSFVGSNREHKANRLLFVTTSSYTKPAIEYAERFAGHFLSLASYDEIRQWCFDVRYENPLNFKLT